jgi:hypothetical protein
MILNMGVDEFVVPITSPPMVCGVVRSPHWPAVRESFLKVHPTCAACGGKIGLNVHHIKPYYLFPKLELVESNLITLCEQYGHHLLFGHLMNWGSWNPLVVSDAAGWLKKVNNRP